MQSEVVEPWLRHSSHRRCAAADAPSDVSGFSFESASGSLKGETGGLDVTTPLGISREVSALEPAQTCRAARQRPLSLLLPQHDDWSVCRLFELGQNTEAG